MGNTLMRPLENLDKAFAGMTPIDPTEWLELEKAGISRAMRAIDILTPIGKGQRGLIVSPPKAGKTTLLKHICQSMAAVDPQMKIYCFLVDERPEEVTDFKRSVPAEVFASSSDRPYEEHIEMAEMVISRAAQEAGSGKNVAILLDSLTRLARVHNTNSNSRRTMTGGLDSRAMEIPRRFFGAARNLEHGGSLTILATILVETGSRMDDIIFQEFKGTGNMELVLSRAAAEARLFPALNIAASGTRKEEKLLPADMLAGAWKLRRALMSLPPLEATRKLIDLLEEYPTNRALLKTISDIS
ncbi:MAG: transcription termination factor Rho [Elusimicrobiota bacterium]